MYNRARAKRLYVYEIPLPDKDRWPRCTMCGKHLKPAYTLRFKNDAGGRASVEYVFSGSFGHEGDGFFCTMRCAYRFAKLVAARLYK